YRLIDTACGYGNEASVGQAIKDSGVPREEIFVVTKLPAEIKTADEVYKSFLGSKERLDVGPIDLYLIHAPWPWDEIGKDCAKGNIETFHVFEELVKEGHILSAGISNFAARDIRPLIENCSLKPAVNQLCHYAGYWEQDAVEMSKQEDIAIMAYSPLGSGRVFQNNALPPIADHYGVSVAQLCIRYLMQQGCPTIPRSKDPTRIADNAKVDFTISKEDMEFLDSLRNA
ncbi:MAG: aldo/keto reductase, partial [Clostridia bacterium]|nr:aldo/keto reductase [Clostridia bacterium]